MITCFANMPYTCPQSEQYAMLNHASPEFDCCLLSMETMKSSPCTPHDGHFGSVGIVLSLSIHQKYQQWPNASAEGPLPNRSSHVQVKPPTGSGHLQPVVRAGELWSC